MAVRGVLEGGALSSSSVAVEALPSVAPSSSTRVPGLPEPCWPWPRPGVGRSHSPRAPPGAGAGGARPEVMSGVSPGAGALDVLPLRRLLVSRRSGCSHSLSLSPMPARDGGPRLPPPPPLLLLHDVGSQ